MTPFEKATLDIATRGAEYSLTADVLAAIALVVSVIGGYLIFNQLHSARWGTLLSLEQDMNARRREVIDIARQLNEPSPPVHLAKIYAATKEGYLNAVDRLASMILNGQFPMKEMKEDYRSFIDSVIRENPNDFRAGTSYRRTLKLHNKWHAD